MTYEEAVEWFKKQSHRMAKEYDDAILAIRSEKYIQSIKLNIELAEKAIEALDKQIPKRKHKYSGFRCVCGELVAKNQDYCEYCGQRLEEYDELK